MALQPIAFLLGAQSTKNPMWLFSRNHNNLQLMCKNNAQASFASTKVKTCEAGKKFNRLSSDKLTFIICINAFNTFRLWMNSWREHEEKRTNQERNMICGSLQWVAPHLCFQLNFLVKFVIFCQPYLLVLLLFFVHFE